MRYLLFGTGEYYNRYKHWFDPANVAALLDNAKDRQGTLIDGIRVMSPQDGIGLKFDVIVILSFYVAQMKAQLMELGIAEDRIYHFFDLHRLWGGKVARRPVQYYGAAESIIFKAAYLQGKEKILLLSHDLTLGGPALALYNAAKVLRDHGYEVVFASMLDGTLRPHLLEDGFPVIVDENLQIETMNEAAWTHYFDLLICNTISYYVFLSERKRDIPVLWWLHDSEFFYDGVDKELLRKIDFHNMDILSVGSVPAKAIRKFIPQLTINELLYCVDDTVGTPDKKVRDNTTVRFATIGYIENRKGQDILIAAIRRLPKTLLERCEFCLVGQNTSVMARQIMEETEDIPQIVITGTVGREEIDAMLEQTDMLICPSREDPMPTVAAEAMMHSVPCIMSSAAGTVDYIRDGESGLVFESENVDELVQAIAWSVCNREKLAGMGRYARAVYEQFFSRQAFTEHLSNVVHKKLQ